MSERKIETAQIRGTHRYSYRSGEWANLLGCVMYPARTPNVTRMCYVVRFDSPDETGTQIDYWPVTDNMSGYEFRNAPS